MALNRLPYTNMIWELHIFLCSLCDKYKVHNTLAEARDLYMRTIFSTFPIFFYNNSIFSKFYLKKSYAQNSLILVKEAYREIAYWKMLFNPLKSDADNWTKALVQ